MGLAIIEDHLALAAVARSFLEAQGGRGPARAALDAPSDQLPKWWGEMAGLGWLGLHLPEDVGGQGYGVAELAVVIEALASVVAPGPFLPTAWASGVIDAVADDGTRRRLLPDLASGARRGAVGLAGELTWNGSALRGDAGWVLGAGLADVVVLVAGEDAFVVESDAPGVHVGEAATSVNDTMDPGRPLARVNLAGVAAAVVIPGGRRDVLRFGRILAAAEAAGLARACTEMATEYAKQRKQFGRVIATFQAVKHHCANMLVDTEMATAAAWDAARCPSGDPAADLVAAVAAAQALPAAVRVAATNVQVLGGIGFTWEHDAHLYLRRANALRAVFATPPSPAADAARLMAEGIRRDPGVDLPPEADEFRDQVRTFRQLLETIPAEGRRSELVTSGYLVPHWPAPWGRGAGPVEQLVIDEELTGVARPSLGIGGWVTLTIAQHGTPDQLQRFVGPSLQGELVFCQLFSEPEAGSDAAAIRSRGTRVDGGWLVNGQKVWTSDAQRANRGFATVRTDPSVPKHQGITMMVIDMTASGVEVRPLRQVTGDAHFNEVFFTDVFVPDDDVVGAPGDGWTVARATLGNERVSIGAASGFHSPASGLLDRVGPTHAERHALERLVVEEQALRALVLRQVSRAIAGGGPGPEGNVTKLVSGEHAKEVTDLILRSGGVDALVGRAGSGARYEYLFAKALTIAGGTSEIVRNQIGERILGLPRDPLLS
jgi:alkylation response protein AidB-like acyl-CoA dehydrogenase